MNVLKLFVNLFHFNRTNWKAVALCFLAASIFWLFSALNKTYSTNITFPLEFEFDRERYAVAAPLPAKIVINVTGNGWDLFRKYFGVRVPVLKVPLERPAETRRIVASTLPTILTSQLGGIEINFVVQDTIRLQIENRDTRKFRLYADLSAITYRDNFARVSPPVIFPDSVELNGPSGILKGLPDSIVLKPAPARAGENFRAEVEVDIPHQQFIKRNPPVVEVRFEVAEVVDVERFVKVRRDRFPWGVVTEQDSLKCLFRLPRKEVTRFEATPLSALVEPADLSRRQTKWYAPTISGLPEYAVILGLDSVKVTRF